VHAGRPATAGAGTAGAGRNSQPAPGRSRLLLRWRCLQRTALGTILQLRCARTYCVTAGGEKPLATHAGLGGGLVLTRARWMKASTVSSEIGGNIETLFGIAAFCLQQSFPLLNIIRQGG